MAKAAACISTPRAILPAPRLPTSQERAAELLMRWRLARTAGVPAQFRLDETAEGPVLINSEQRRRSRRAAVGVVARMQPAAAGPSAATCNHDAVVEALQDADQNAREAIAALRAAGVTVPALLHRACHAIRAAGRSQD